MKKLFQRLQILEQSNTITQKTKEKLLHMISYLKSAYSIILDEDNGGRFITHTAMAIERIEKGEGFKQGHGVMEEEIRKEENFTKAQAIADDLEQNIFKMEFPLQEKYFIITNLLVLMEDL